MIQSSFTPIDVFITFFREMIGDLGDFDEIASETDSVVVLYCFFFTATILLTIAMLNLLIAIISDTFSRVKCAENLTKIWEKWNIITEIDDSLSAGKKIMIPKDNDKNNLLFLYNDCHFKTEINEFTELKKSLEVVGDLKKTIELNDDKMEKNFEKISLMLKEVVEKLDKKESIPENEIKEIKEDKIE